MRSQFYVSGALAALCLGAPVYAQDVPAQSSAVADGADNSDAIVVTARRRAEALNDVPISIAAISGEGLEARGVERVEDLQFSTPSLTSRPTSGRRSVSQYEIRGIASVESLITQDPTVGVYVDEVYRARATGTNQSFYDIANVQVLYGPQGTLFGRNSTGGAILITTNRPTDRFEGSMEAGYGRFDRLELTGMVNVPLSESLIVRLAGQRVRSDGYVKNVTTGGKLGGTNAWSGRGSILFDKGSFTNLTVASYYHANDQGTPNKLYGYRASTVPNQYGQVPALAAFGLNPLMIPAFAAAREMGFYRTALDGVGGNIPLAGGGSIPLVGRTGYLLDGSVANATDPFERTRNFSVMNTTTLELGDGLLLKNIFGYNYMNLKAATDLDGTPLKLIDSYYDTTNRTITNELQLQGEGSRFNWTVGGLFFRERGIDDQRAVTFFSTYTDSLLLGINKSYAVFAQGTYKLTDQLSLTAGGRYTWDKRYFRIEPNRVGSAGAAFATNGGFGTDFGLTATCGLAPAIVNTGTCGRSGRKSFAEPSWTASLDYKLMDDHLVYIAHRHGYRAGGFNARVNATSSAQQQLAQTLPFDPEKVNDVEVGYKGTLRVGEVRLTPSIALYKAWYSGIQKDVTTFAGTQGVTIITNAGEAKVKGLEASLGIQPVRGFNIDLFYGYVDGHFKDFPAPGTSIGTLIPTVPFAGAKHNFGASFSLTPIDNAEVGRVTYNAAYGFKSSMYPNNSGPTLSAEAKIPGQHNLNLSVMWENIGSTNFSLNGWVRNATGERNVSGVVDLVPSFGIAIATIAEPRTYGISLKYAFGQ